MEEGFDFADIIALATEEVADVPLEEKLASYDRRDGRHLLREWKKYAALVPSLRDTAPLSTRPALREVKAFFLWRVTTGKGRIDPKMTTSTLCKELNRLDRVVTLSVGHGYNKEEKMEIKKAGLGYRPQFSSNSFDQFIEKDLPKLRGASTKQRAKPVALYADVEDLLYFLWCCDEYDWVHPRVQIHISFFLILQCFYGLRPGEIIESTSLPGINEGITHGDVILSLARHNGKPRYQIKVLLRNRKFRRDKEGEAMAIDLYEELDSTKRFTCAVTYYIAMALADEVFVDQTSPEDFAKRYIPPSANSQEFRVREEKKTIPVIRKLEGRKISAHRIMAGGSMNQYLVGLGERAGYKDRITGYAFRRGFANGIEGQVSAPKLRQLLGHTNDGTIQSYMTTTVGIDTQNAIRGLPQDKQTIDFSRSVAYTRDINAPKPFGSTPCVSQFISLHETESMATKFPNKPKRSLVAKLLTERSRQARIEYFTTPKGGGDKTPDAGVVQRVQPLPSRYFNLMLKYDPLLQRVISGFWSEKSVLLESVVQPLMARAVPTAFQLQYPGIKPLEDGHCPYCWRLTASREALHAYQFHVLQCASKIYGYRRPYCFRCASFLPTGSQFCINHPTPDIFCGLVIRYGLMLQPGRCPFCKDKVRLFYRWVDLRNHLEVHISHMTERCLFACPLHPLDTLDLSGNTSDAFRHHLSQMHGINWEIHSGRSPRASEYSFDWFLKPIASGEAISCGILVNGIRGPPTPPAPVYGSEGTLSISSTPRAFILASGCDPAPGSAYSSEDIPSISSISRAVILASDCDLAPNESKEKRPDGFAKRRLRPVRDNLGRLRKATQKNYLAKENLARVLKCELIAIGNFIRAETYDNKDLEERLWNYTVINYWPYPNVTVPQVQKIYSKMLSSEMNNK